MPWARQAIVGSLIAALACDAGRAAQGDSGPGPDREASASARQVPDAPVAQQPDRGLAPIDSAVRQAQVRVEQEVTPNADKVYELPTLVTPSGKIRPKPSRPVPFAPPLLSPLLGLEDTPVRVFGWIQNSFTGNPSQPSDGMNFGVNPNDLANRWMGNQYYLVVENPLEQDDTFNLGFRVDNLFGNDWQFNHMVGLFDTSFQKNHFAGYDPAQMYINAHLPILTPGGLDIKGGRWYSIAGYEGVPAISRPLLSVPYMFNYGQPFTFFGALASLNLSDRLKLQNGTVNGWDRWINRHDKWGYVGSLNWSSKRGKVSLSTALVWGPDQLPKFLKPTGQKPPTGITPPPFLAGLRNPGYGGNDRALFTTVLTLRWTERFTQVIETDQAFENNVPGLGRGGTSQNAEWYSFGNWWLYQFAALPALTGVWRSEVFRDNNGIRTGFADTFYEMTLGAIYKPRPWLWIRPEARYDWAQFTHPYNGGRSGSQFTMGFDAIFLF